MGQLQEAAQRTRLPGGRGPRTQMSQVCVLPGDKHHRVWY